MTEQTQPTDAEIESLWDSFVGDPTEKLPLTNSDKITFARAVLAKWGTPAPVGVEPAPSADGPKELWLQLHGDCLPHEQSEPVDYTSGDVTWCWHGIHDSDVRYVRADLAAEQVFAMGRKPLTAVQVYDAIKVFKEANNLLGVNHLHVARAIEAAHGIKNGGQHG